MATQASLRAIYLLYCVLLTNAFVGTHRLQIRTPPLNLFGSSGAKIPGSSNERDSLAISSIKAAINKPKTAKFGLIECEFPPLAALNKLGDGSLRSANQVDTANLAFTKKLISSLAPLPVLGPKIWLLTSASAPASFVAGATKAGGTLHSLRNGLPETLTASDICVLVAPSSSSDYNTAQQMAMKCKAVVLINGFAKDPQSVSDRATMAYFLKPLTYNSQVVGYLSRAYPGPWCTIDGTTQKVLATKTDGEILVRGTNTPDLRESGRLVQKVVDERAIKARQT